jgi:uncharacterized damage-inducible protein DinB
MSERGAQWLDRADRQIARLRDLLSIRGEEILILPCPGHEKLGDGTVGATIGHISRVYLMLAGFIQGGDPHRDQGHGTRGGLEELVEQMSSATHALRELAVLSDAQLESVPPEGSFRFCDGRRTLEQVIENVVNHQAHHVDAVTSAMSN